MVNLEKFPPVPYDRRREMHCGWMEDTEWLYPIRLGNRFIGAIPEKSIDGVEWDQDVCPGWVVRQPMIEEIAMANIAFNKGNLDVAFPEVASCLIEGVYELQRVAAAYEARQLKLAEDKVKD